ncbi:uncharacterized protein PV07_10336 [Cladophialophora immunda]|uniref:Uncharacterized protein n=1 Tax=Cladophialophora immunda TaxID=569365 RepID=A0A0D2AIB2_9EURO|nr:uncharacterized protein PV07_10336 [Cladophialophora immunda]KIW24632.1 hypothetical protein PV07_10336 [Cladophialophora immunda]
MPPAYSRHAYFCELKFPDVDTIDVLNGKSNFYQWHSDIQPVLLSNPYSSDLILGSWTEPQYPPSWTVEDQALFDEERREWDAANTATCRFIRATLATNVGPFVRQYTAARTLFFNLVWLYGEEAGIDSQGGPPVPVNAETLNAKKGRAGLLAALEAKRTMDYLPAVSTSLKPSASIVPGPQTKHSNHEVTFFSASRTEPPASRDKSTKWQATIASEPTDLPDQNTAIGRPIDRTRITSDPSLETIHEHDEPHPGRRVPSGYAIDFDYSLSRGDQGQWGRSVSPLSPSDSGSEYGDDDEDQDECHLEDTDVADPAGRSTSRSTKRPAGSPDLEPSAAKAGITSILRTVTANNRARKRDKFTFSFPLRRLNPEKERAKGEDRARAEEAV